MGDPVGCVLADLRVQAARDPKGARLAVESLADSDPRLLDALLNEIAAPNEGRLRQLVASVAWRREDRTAYLPHLRRWIEDEPDEFSREAIIAVLEEAGSQHRRGTHVDDSSDIIAAYRYVAGRLCHRVRNTLPGVFLHLRKVEDLVAQGADGGQVQRSIDALRESFRGISRIVEFDTDDEYFEWRDVDLVSWVKNAEREYNTKNETVNVVIESTVAPCVRANDYLLETVFWNLWRNSSEASIGQCRVFVRIAAVDEEKAIEITVSDSGLGLPEKVAVSAFELSVSTNGTARGRGLMEVADAIRRLGGRPSVVRIADGSHAVRLNLPCIHCR